MSERSNQGIHRRETAMKIYQDLFIKDIGGKIKLQRLLQNMRYSYPEFVKEAKKMREET